MRIRHTTLLILASCLALCCAICYVIACNDAATHQKNLKKHCKVIAVDVWNYDDQGSVEYLALAARVDNYETLKVFAENDREFLEIQGPEPGWLEQRLIGLGLIRLEKHESEIQHDGEKIGRLEVIHRLDTIYAFAYVFVVCVLLGLAAMSVVRIYRANQALKHERNSLESRVKERTADLENEIAERKRSKVEREKLIVKLEAQNDELARFTYTVSHDLKSPLITIRGFAGILLQDLLEGNSRPMEEDLSRIINAADKMDLLLRDLLELSRIGRLVNPPEEVSLVELAREACELVSGQASKNGVVVEISPSLPVVYGDRVRLLEVMQNLVDNAVKYTGRQPQPRVEIGSRTDGNETICYVRDNGIGVEPCYHEKVFGLFNQLDPKVEGSGIGLALVKRIVEVHGGRIWVESEGAGKGSSFCFTIPAVDEATDPRGAEA